MPSVRLLTRLIIPVLPEQRPARHCLIQICILPGTIRRRRESIFLEEKPEPPELPGHVLFYIQTDDGENSYISLILGGDDKPELYQQMNSLLSMIQKKLIEFSGILYYN